MRYFPSIFLILTLGCTTSTKELPILSYTINDEGNKTYYSISYKGFTNQLGQSFSTGDIQGKVTISNFFFTRCPSICPSMRLVLIDLAKVFSGEKDILIISHTIDPKHDSVEVLKQYWETTEIPHNTWQFIRAPEAKTKAQAKQYMTNFKPNNDGTDFYHSSFVALVDKKQHIRGFYNLLVIEDVERLKKDIRQLL